ncbi:hypothetical protein ABK905_20430 [Acerihabitans sp. KWT182]|uniref:Uncharacterized protein n=1 Tax=Acerihabitans sp. KWT182 TaxID=3157919 RepID=A0AAU7Q733_9GAMM
MKESNIFSKLKMRFIGILQAKFPNNGKYLSFDYNADLDQRFENNMIKLQDAIILLNEAEDADDKVAAKVALVYIRVYAMNLSNFFEDFKDDADLLRSSSIWPDIHENYQLPKHYNFPHK